MSFLSRCGQWLGRAIASFGLGETVAPTAPVPTEAFVLIETFDDVSVVCRIEEAFADVYVYESVDVSLDIVTEWLDDAGVLVEQEPCVVVDASIDEASVLIEVEFT